MKKTFTLLLFSSFCFMNAQGYKGKGDAKFDVGMNIQNGGSGIGLFLDFGSGENMSFGFVTSYLLSMRIKG